MASWLTITPKSGTGTADVSVKAVANTGRSKRTASITATTSLKKSKSVALTQNGKAEFITFDTTVIPSVANTGGTVIISGKSNSPKLKVIESGDINLNFNTLTINGSTESYLRWDGETDTSISGDPGNTAEYTFSFKFSVPANNTSLKRTWNIKLEGSSTSVSTPEILISQLNGVQTYSELTISAFTYPKATAGGGTLTPTLTYTQTWGWNGSTTGGGTLNGTLSAPISGATVAFTKNVGTVSVNDKTGAATVMNLGKKASSSEFDAGTINVTITANGKSKTASAHVMQAPNTITYGEIVFNQMPSALDIPAGGGKSVAVLNKPILVTQTINWASGSSSVISGALGDSEATPVIEKITFSQTTAVSAPSLGTVAKERTLVGNITFTAIGAGGKTKDVKVAVYQAANEASYSEVTNKEHSPVLMDVKGQTYFLTGGILQTVSYTSGASRAVTLGKITNVVVKTPVTGYSFAKENNSVSVTENTGINPRNGYTLTVTTAGEGGKSASKDVIFNQPEAESYIAISPEAIVFDAIGGTKQITITSNDSWTIA